VATTARPHWPDPRDIAGWRPILTVQADHPAASGQIAAGAVYEGYAPAGAFSLTQGGRPVARQPAFGWAGQYPAATAGPAKFSLHQFPYVFVAVLVEVVGWVVLASALLGWPRRRRPEVEEL
jgi:hypothetical protein